MNWRTEMLMKVQQELSEHRIGLAIAATLITVALIIGFCR